MIKTGHPHIQDELNNILAVVGLLPENCVIVDAGANIGLVAIPMAQAVAARHGVVHAFEVQRMMFYALCGSAALNDLETLILYNQALGANLETLAAGQPDYGRPQDFGLYSLVGQPEAGPNRVDVVTIDSLGLPRLDFVKIDVEGMEIDVLKGCRNSLKRHQPWCWVEYWKVNVDDIKAQFAGLHYKFYVMDRLNLLCAPVARLVASPLTINAPEI